MIRLSAMRRCPTSARKIPFLNNHNAYRTFSDNLLGYSPMSNPVRTDANVKKDKQAAGVNPGASGPSWGVDANTAGGGVWANTSAKRDKLTELRGELTDAQETLDDAASRSELLDLHLVDGIRFIARSVDECWSDQSVVGGEGLEKLDASISEFLQSSPVVGESTDGDVMLDKKAYERHLRHILQKVGKLTSLEVPSVTSSDTLIPAPIISSLAHIRSFDEGGEAGLSDSSVESSDDLSKSFDDCTSFYRALLVESIVEHLESKWDELTEITSSDIDRAAIAGEVDLVGSRDSISLFKVNNVIKSFYSKSCLDRVEALWDLVDSDSDELIDQEEMDRVAWMSILPVGEALKKLVNAVVESHPMHVESEENLGWRQRRREKKAKESFKKNFGKAVTRHFDIEAETPHRLRCLYAWAEKKHQAGKVKSVLIDSGSIVGRKRYVELNPKISFEEFRSTKNEIFTEIERVGEEFVSSFREDLHVIQGKGRQNRELKRDCLIGLGVLAVGDIIIMML